MQRRTVLKAMGAVPIASTISLSSCAPDTVGSKPTRFSVTFEGGTFNDSEVAESIAKLKASGQIPETAPVRVTMIDRQGNTWGSPRTVILVQGTATSFAAGETLHAAKAGWADRLKKLNIKGRPLDEDLAGCIVEVPGAYGPNWPVKA